jgi:hypothetical protein
MTDYRGPVVRFDRHHPETISAWQDWRNDFDESLYFEAPITGNKGTPGSVFGKHRRASVFLASEGSVQNCALKYPTTEGGVPAPNVALAEPAEGSAYLLAGLGATQDAPNAVTISIEDRSGDSWAIPDPGISASIVAVFSEVAGPAYPSDTYFDGDLPTTSLGRGPWLVVPGDDDWSKWQCPYDVAIVAHKYPGGMFGLYEWTWDSGTEQWSGVGGSGWPPLLPPPPQYVGPGFTYALRRDFATGVLSRGDALPYCGPPIEVVTEYTSNGVMMLQITAPASYRAAQVLFPGLPMFAVRGEVRVIQYTGAFSDVWQGSPNYATPVVNSDVPGFWFGTYVGPAFLGRVRRPAADPDVLSPGGGWAAVDTVACDNALPTWVDVTLPTSGHILLYAAAVGYDEDDNVVDVRGARIYIVPGPAPCPHRMFARGSAATKY